MKRRLNKSNKNASPDMLSEQNELSVSISEDMSFYKEKESKHSEQETNNIIKLPSIMSKTILNMNKEIVIKIINKNKKSFSPIKLKTIVENNEFASKTPQNIQIKVEQPSSKPNENKTINPSSMMIKTEKKAK